MILVESLNSDIKFTAKNDEYEFKYWTDVSVRKFENKKLIIITASITDNELNNFLNKHKDFDIHFKTLMRNSNMEEENELSNEFKNMKIVMAEKSMNPYGISDNILIFGDKNTTDKDAIDVINKVDEEELIDKVTKRLLKKIKNLDLRRL